MINNKANFVFLALLFTFFSSLAQAGGSAPPATCYPLVHGEGGQGARNSLYLPHMFTVAGWSAHVMVTNISDKYLNVKLHFNDYEGAVYAPYSFVFEGEFNQGNSPFALSTGGAILRPGKTARVNIYDDNNAVGLAGRISWQADACIDRALLVSARNHYQSGGGITSSLMLLNNGQPF